MTITCGLSVYALTSSSCKIISYTGLRPIADPQWWLCLLALLLRYNSYSIKFDFQVYLECLVTLQSFIPTAANLEMHLYATK